MADEPKETESSMTLYYLIGAAIVVAIAAGVYFFRPGQASVEPSGTNTVAQPPPQPTRPTGPITQLACETQYYNPVVGFPRYYLTTEGADIPSTNSVACSYSVSVAGKEMAKESVTVKDFTDAPSRGGKTFRCMTRALSLEKTVPTRVDVVMTNDRDEIATCSGTFNLP